MGMKRALITGITGQDGSYLAEMLLLKGYAVYGLVRRQSSSQGLARISHLLPKITLLCGDLVDISSLVLAMSIAEPDEVYHLAAQSHVGESFKQPIATAQYNAIGTLNMLECCPKTARFYNAATSEMYGSPSFGETKIHPGDGFTENDVFMPCSPYATSKLAAYWYTRNYRESYGMFAVNGILFNHESPRRGEEFVTRKITRFVAKAKMGAQITLDLGNIEAQRDWGYAPEYVEAMWKMLQAERPDDYVIATGKPHSVRQFVEYAFHAAGLDPYLYVCWGNSEQKRPNDVAYLCGDASKAREELGWSPTVGFEELVRIMVEHDIQEAQTGKM